MDKNQVLSFIEAQLQAGKITEAEVMALMHVPAPVQVTNTAQVVLEKPRSSHWISYALYSIGAVIILSGIGVLTAQYWDDIGFLGRVTVTLGVGFLAYIIALMLRGPSNRILSQVLFTLSVALAPAGIFVLLYEGQMPITKGVNLTIAAALAIIYGVAYLISRRTILIFFTTAFMTWAYYAVLFIMFDFRYFDEIYIQWATIFLGVAYICQAYGLASSRNEMSPEIARERRGVSGLLYLFGTLAVLGAGIMIGGIFDLVYILLVFAAFYASVGVRSRSMLLLSAGFLIGHIVKLTSKYFVNSLGWPVALIGIGVIVIAIGYFTVYLSKQYFSKKA